MLSGQHGTLHTTIEAPWLKTFQLGQGMNALTGEAAASALESFEALEWGTVQTSSVLKVKAIEQLHELSDDFQMKLNATINLGTPTASITEKVEVLKSKAFSQREFIVECTVAGEYNYDQLELRNLRLMAAARECLELKGPQVFRNQYGDYFVAGFQRHYKFYAIMVCKARENEDIKSSKISAESHLGNILRAEAGVDLSAKRSSYDFVTGAYISQYGCNFLPPDSLRQESFSAPFAGLRSVDINDAFKSLWNAAASATQHRGTPKVALLKHYSLLFGEVPKEVPISSKVFTMLHEAEECCTRLDIDCLHPALLAYDSIVKKTQEAVKAFRNERIIFVNDDNSREAAVQSLREVERQVNDLIKRYKFMEKLVNSDNGPKIGEKVKLGRAGIQRKQYGEVEVVGRESNAGSENVSAVGESLAEDVEFMGGLPAFHTLVNRNKEGEAGKLMRALKWSRRPDAHLSLRRLSPRVHEASVALPSLEIPGPGVHFRKESFYIVGWTISCETNKDCDKSFRVEDGGILTDTLDIAVTSSSPHAHWRCRIVYVLAADYNFPTLLEQQQGQAAAGRSKKPAF